MHWIRRYILEQLLYSEHLRNRDMRPPRVESNLFQYHLNQLIVDKFITKTDQGYTLDHKGLAWADRYSSKLKAERLQPKIVTILGLVNTKGEYLLIPRPRQPYVTKLHFPSGKVHQVQQGERLEDAAKREAAEKLNLPNLEITPAGWVHIVITSQEATITDYIGFLFTARCPKGYEKPAGACWASAKQLPSKELLMPGVDLLIGCFTSKDPYSEHIIRTD